jgi:hypothetical protein
MNTSTPVERRGREEKIDLARRWQSSGLTQQQFATEHGISPRTLRSYLRLVPDRHWDDQIRAAVSQAIMTLGGVLQALDGNTAGAQGAPGAPRAPSPPAPAEPTGTPAAISEPRRRGPFNFLGDD